MLRAPEILAALSPMHVRAGLQASRTPSYEGCFVFQASGNGGCLFTSLRLCVEAETATELALRILSGEPPPQPMPIVLLDGFSPSIVAEGNYVRKKVVEWYVGAKQARVVPSMGAFEHGGRPWTRGDILNMELVKRGAAGMPDAEEARAALRDAYLCEMLTHTTWGSVPEWTAYAMLRKTTTVAYEWDAAKQGLRAVDTAYGQVEDDPALDLAPWPPTERPRVPSPSFGAANSSDDLALFEDAASECSSDSASECTSASEDSASEDASEGVADNIASAATSVSPSTHLERAWRPVSRLLFSGKHYDCLITAHEYYSIRAVFGPDAVRCAVPLAQYKMGRR